jgi:hypothetical protein
MLEDKGHQQGEETEDVLTSSHIQATPRTQALTIDYSVDPSAYELIFSLIMYRPGALRRI